MESSQVVWLVVDLIKSSSQAAPHVHLQLSKPLPTSSTCEQGKIKNCQTESVSWQVSLHLWLRTCWSDSCWSQAGTRAGLNLFKEPQHPKETVASPRDNSPQDHLDNDLPQDTGRNQSSVQWTRAPHTCRALRSSQAHGKRSFMSMLNYVAGCRVFFMKKWWKSCCKMKFGHTTL